MPSIESIPAAKLAWATDLHLNFLRPPEMDRFLEAVEELAADALVVTGDISDGPRLGRDLAQLAGAFSGPLFFVLGNHDRYHSSFAEADRIAAEVAAAHAKMRRLDGSQIIQLSRRTALIGMDGWADGLAGEGRSTSVRLNDTVLIRDLAMLPEPLQWEKMQELAEGFAKAAEDALERAMPQFEQVILATHVPPLPEAAWHQGRMSDPDFLPHFSSPTLGKVIRGAAARWPEKKITVLCGHTHGAGMHREANLEVITGGTEYGEPRIDRVLAVS